MYREAARRTLLQLGGDDVLLHDALRTMLQHRDGSLLECERLIAEMLATRDQWGELVPLGARSLRKSVWRRCVPRLDRTLELEVCRGLGELARAIPQGILDEIDGAGGRDGRTLPGRGEGPSPMAICAGIDEHARRGAGSP